MCQSFADTKQRTNSVEAIGQARNYAAQTGKRPGIVLILERPGDTRYLERIQTVDRAFGLGITVWTLDREGRSPDGR